jgi:hypothetical protein
MAHMNRFFMAVAALAMTMPTWAGVTYRFTTTTEGTRESAVSGIVKNEGAKGRVEITAGDELIFKRGTVVLSSGGTTITVFDPAKKTYYDLDLAKYLRQTAGGQNSFVNVEIRNPRVTVRELGAGETIQGYPTRRARLITSFEVIPKYAGKLQMEIGMNLDSEIWLTDKLPADAASILQSSRLRTGVDAIDKIIEQSAALHGFPLKQVTTSKATIGGMSPSAGKSTTVVSDIRQVAVPASEFVVPAGFVKTDDPVAAMMKKLGLQ